MEDYIIPTHLIHDCLFTLGVLVGDHVCEEEAAAVGPDPALQRVVVQRGEDEASKSGKKL